MRVILDANVPIAAVAARGLCEAVVELCLEQHQIILCEGLLAEIRTKLEEKLKVPPHIARDYIRLLKGNSELHDPEPVDHSVCRDPNDLMVLGLIGPARADVVVTGDKDLLVVGKYKTAHILTPREFWQHCRTAP